MAGSDITIEILKEIRDAARGTTLEVGKTNTRLDSMEAALTVRLDLVETALLDLTEQNRFHRALHQGALGATRRCRAARQRARRPRR